MASRNYMEKWPEKCGLILLGVCEIDHITNAQNQDYWKDDELARIATKGNDLGSFDAEKKGTKAKTI